MPVGDVAVSPVLSGKVCIGQRLPDAFRRALDGPPSDPRRAPVPAGPFRSDLVAQASASQFAAAAGTKGSQPRMMAFGMCSVGAESPRRGWGDERPPVRALHATRPVSTVRGKAKWGWGQKPQK